MRLKDNLSAGVRECWKGRESKEEERPGASLRKKAGLFTDFLPDPFPSISLSLIYFMPQAQGPALGGWVGKMAEAGKGRLGGGFWTSEFFSAAFRSSEKPRLLWRNLAPPVSGSTVKATSGVGGVLLSSARPPAPTHLHSSPAFPHGGPSGSSGGHILSPDFQIRPSGPPTMGVGVGGGREQVKHPGGRTSSEALGAECMKLVLSIVSSEPS